MRLTCLTAVLVTGYWKSALEMGGLHPMCSLRRMTSTIQASIYRKPWSLPPGKSMATTSTGGVQHLNGLTAYISRFPMLCFIEYLLSTHCIFGNSPRYNWPKSDGYLSPAVAFVS